jgi:List-Bact-rpt repeat protein/galactose oxidase-like protein/Kelch motif protein
MRESNTKWLLAIAFILLPLSEACADSWSPAGTMSTARVDHTATLLSNGKVLEVGGYSGAIFLASVDIYDPATNVWTPAAPLPLQRASHTTTLLNNGKALVVGGNYGPGYLATTEIYDPVSNTWSVGASLSYPIINHTATLLADGRVLVAGGSNGGNALASVSIYDPTANAWSSAASLNTARWGATAVLLNDGTVLIVGGNNTGNQQIASSEIYDPSDNTWTQAGNLATGRSRHTMTLLLDGTVLVAGGIASSGGSTLSSAELFNPNTRSWTTVGSLNTARELFTATRLQNGSVLVAGGITVAYSIGSAELYDSASKSWNQAASLITARAFHTASALQDGRELIAGGADVNLYSSAEVYNPVPPPTTLTVQVSGQGTVTSNPTGLNCSSGSGNCSTSFPGGVPITMSATPAANYLFAGWSGACSGSNSCVVTLNANATVTATFVPASSVPVTLSVQVTGSGTVTAPPGSINCGVACSSPFVYGTSVTLTATPTQGGSFLGWSGACSGTGSCVVVMNSSQSVGAAFSSVTFPLNVTVISGAFTVGGSVVSMPAGILCPTGACNASFSSGNTVQLTATPNTGFLFVGWGGACNGNGACSVVMGTATSVTATFASAPATPLTGFWLNPNEGGRGYVIEQRGGNLFMAAFLYDPSGRATWYGIGPGAITGSTYTGTLTSYSGGQTLTGSYIAPTNVVAAGNFSITFSSATQALMTWPGGTVPIQKYDFGPGGSATTQPVGTPQPGWWYAPTEGGRGYAIEVQGNTMYLAGYMYDTQGNPVWYLSSGAMTDISLYQGEWQQYGNGQTLTGSYHAPSVVNAAVGTVTLQFNSTTTATLTLPNGRQVQIERYPF